MSDESGPVDFEAVRKHELDEISKRRREADVPPVKDQDGHSQSPAADLVGLSLSGGGVRSATFNLGFLQSLYQKGVLRHVDYLSTVSGGGYIGSSLSSLALHPDTEFDWKAGEPSEAEEESDKSPGRRRHFPLEAREDGRQPPRVLELIHGGHYLRRPLIFLNRYLVGVLLTNIVALSLVFALAALAAWLFRCLDHTWMINWLFALGFQGDVGRAFFPMWLFFSLWLVMWLVSYWRKGSQAEGRVARWFMTLTIVSLLLACAALLGTGDVSLTYLRDNYGIETNSDLIRSIGGELKTYFIIALAIALIPYLRIRELIRSGTRPRSAAEGWVFSIASRALLYGIPLLIFGWLAQENISHFNENRFEERYGQKFNSQYDLVPLEIVDWADTWQTIELQASGAVDPEENRFAVSRRIWEALGDQQKNVSRSVSLVAQISEFDRRTSMMERWLQYAAFVITRQGGAVNEQFQRREDYLTLRQDVCSHLTTYVLSDPTFFQSFEAADHTSTDENLAIQMTGRTADEQRSRVAKIKTLIPEARHLKMNVQGLASSSTSFENWLNEHKEAGALDTSDEIQRLQDAGVGSYASWLQRRNNTLAQLDKNAAAGITENSIALRKDLQELMQLANGDYARLETEVKALNWQLMENYWGDRLSPKSTVYAMVCLSADQVTRWNWFLWSLGFFVASACIVNMNATSLHGFYRNMLAKMWITECPGIGRKIPLARLETAARGAPYHLIAATVHMLGRRSRTDRSTTDTFIFSQSFCGSDRTGYARTENYMNGRFDLSNAMALSGAAVSPTQAHNPLLAVLLMLSNSRLGQWLPNPGHNVLIPDWIDRFLSWFPPVPLRLAIGALQNAEQRNYCFVSDGGHHENLGLEPLLLRRCRVIIASDMTADPRYEFRDLVRLLRRMRFEYGIRIVGLNGQHNDLPLDTLIPEYIRSQKPEANKDDSRLSEDSLAEAHYFIAKIIYPEDSPEGTPREGLLVYAKPNFTGDEAVDLMQYPLEDAAFPHDPTTDQFYDPQKFESYRQLGFHVGNTICREQFEEFRHHNEFSPSLGQWSPQTKVEGERTADQTGDNSGDSAGRSDTSVTQSSQTLWQRPRPPK